MEHLESSLENLIHRELFGLAKKLSAAGAYTTHIRRLRCAAQINGGRTHRRNDHEGLVTDDRIIAFDPTLIVWVVPGAFWEGNTGAAPPLVAVAIILRKPDAPAIADRTTIPLRRRSGRDARLSGRPRRPAFGNVDRWYLCLFLNR